MSSPLEVRIMARILMKYIYLFFEKIMLSILSNMQVPEHIGFICDGNRTYGKTRNVTVEKAYKRGIHKILKCSLWSQIIGVKEITFYLFGVTNLSRDEETIGKVFDVIHYYLRTLLSREEEQSDNSRIYSYRIVGDLSLVSEQIQEACKQLEAIAKTKTEAKLMINLAIGYSGKQDMIDASAEVLRYFYEKSEKVDENLFNKFLQQKNGLFISTTIRTSHHKRISDFLTWQVVDSCMTFSSKCWPEISVYDLFKSVIHSKLCGVKHQRYI